MGDRFDDFMGSESDIECRIDVNSELWF
ncbi:MAG: hypothetical protein K0R47_3372, partial [Brevibacillus sp.]|nr:hypothetical protein [Brevibacillus sp.]